MKPKKTTLTSKKWAFTWKKAPFQTSNCALHRRSRYYIKETGIDSKENADYSKKNAVKNKKIDTSLKKNGANFKKNDSYKKQINDYIPKTINIIQTSGVRIIKCHLNTKNRQNFQEIPTRTEISFTIAKPILPLLKSLDSRRG